MAPESRIRQSALPTSRTVESAHPVPGATLRSSRQSRKRQRRSRPPPQRCNVQPVHGPLVAPFVLSEFPAQLHEALVSRQRNRAGRNARAQRATRFGQVVAVLESALAEYRTELGEAPVEFT